MSWRGLKSIQLETQTKTADRLLRQFLIVALIGASLATNAATRNAATESIPRGQRFVRTFASSTNSTTPPGQKMLKADFISPLGETNQIYGFWNGGATWQLRFRPELCGRWKWSTSCSESNNAALHGQTGEFLCTAPAHRSAFEEHGALQISRDGRRFEHADHASFALLIDANRLEAQQMSSDLWTRHTHERAAENFTAKLLSIWPGTNSAGQSAFHHSRILEPDFTALNELDAKIDALNQAGLVALVAPLWEIGVRDQDLLSEDEAIMVWRQALGRWGANQVVWVFACEGQGLGAKISRWKKIARAAFDDSFHAPVIFFPGTTAWLNDEFRDEPWVAAFGFQTSDANQPAVWRELLMGPLASEWKRKAARPLLNLAPGNTPQLAWWSLLLSPPCGTSANAAVPQTARALAEFLKTTDAATLLPLPRLLVKQPGYESPSNFVAVAASESRDLCVAYLPSAGSVELVTKLLPPSPQAFWFNARTSEKTRASGLPVEANTQFTPPFRGDWLLVIQSRVQ